MATSITQVPEKVLQIPINEPAEKFRKHLALKENKRILFSGMFGMGKTYFLNKFFKNKDTEQEQKYNVIHIQPVHYSVSSNEDVFEYLKYDIASRLFLVDEITINNSVIPEVLHNFNYLINRPGELLAPLLKFLPLFGDAMAETHAKFKALAEAMEEDYKKQSTEYGSLQKLFSTMENKVGSIYENDFYTLLIKTLLKRWKNQQENTENILIIDDLDRIDPEHVFRLFNIFAAHTISDLDSEPENKFSFDKVIFVCDIDNIRHLFASKYGESVDFSGYIDKFYSNEVFYFNNKKAISAAVKDIIRKSEFDRSYRDLDEIKYLNKQLQAGNIHNNLVFIISKLIEYNSISLRTALKLFNKPLPFIYENIVFDNGVNRVGVGQIELFLIHYVLRTAFNDERELMNAITKCINSNIQMNLYNRNELELIDTLIFVSDLSNNKLETANTHSFSHGESFGFTYKVSTYDHKYSGEIVTINGQRADKYNGIIPYFSLLKMAIENINKYKTL